MSLLEKLMNVDGDSRVTTRYKEVDCPGCRAVLRCDPHARADRSIGGRCTGVASVGFHGGVSSPNIKIWKKKKSDQAPAGMSWQLELCLALGHC